MLMISATQPSSGGKRLALLCEHFYPEMVSTGLHMTELAVSLAAGGWRIRAYCAAAPEHPEVQPARELLEGVEIRRVHPGRRQGLSIAARLWHAGSYAFKVAARIVRDRRELGASLVTTNPPFLGLIALAARWLFKLPYALIVYDVYPDTAINLGLISSQSVTARLWESLSRLILNRATVAIVIGRDMERVIRNKLSNPRVLLVTIPNWSDERKVRLPLCTTNRFVRECGLEGKIVVQYAGNMGRTHNLEAVIAAAEEFKHEPNLVFQFIGDGAKKPVIEQMVRDAALRNVQLLPYQPIARLSEMLSAAHLAIVALSSEFTGLSVPSKAYAAMANGVPILGLLEPSSEIGRVINETGCGMVLHPAHDREVAAVVRDLLRYPDRFQAMGEAGRRAFLHSYTLTRAVQQYDWVLRNTLGTTACRDGELSRQRPAPSQRPELLAETRTLLENSTSRP
jgi:colanic acid biosynthesis glycosyl transferase WcaI